MSRHKWEWVWPGTGRLAGWLRFWHHPTRRCVRCKARLRLANTGPRGGTHYSYAEKGQKFGIVAHIPECSFRRAGGGPPVSQGATTLPDSSPGTPAVGPTESVEAIIARYEGYAAEWRAKGRAKEAEAMDEIVARLKDGTATETVA